MNYKELKNEFNINIKLIDKFLNFLLETNKKFNLTAIKKKNEMIEKHVYDSLMITKIFNFENKIVLDVGSGGGFPGIPLAIFCSKTKFILIDANNKKINYLNKVIDLLQLKNVETICSRIENINKIKYDVIISRALTKLVDYFKITAHLIKKNNYIIALKGKNGENELKNSNFFIKKLKLKLIFKQFFLLPNCKHNRINFIFKKIN